MGNEQKVDEWAARVATLGLFCSGGWDNLGMLPGAGVISAYTLT